MLEEDRASGGRDHVPLLNHCGPTRPGLIRRFQAEAEVWGLTNLVRSVPRPVIQEDQPFAARQHIFHCWPERSGEHRHND